MQTTGEIESRAQFAENLTATRTRIFAYVLTRVGNNRAIAEDVTQDCFVQTWKARAHNPPPSGALYSYLIKTAQNILHDRHRRRTNAPTLPWDEALPANATTPETQFVLRETMERIATQMALLPHTLRETLHLRVVEGWDYPAIAARLGCPVGTIKSRLSAARAHLRTVLAEQERIPPTSTRHTVQVSNRREINITFKENKTMANGNQNDPLRLQVEAMEVRLSALEQRNTQAPSPSIDVWEAPRLKLMQDLTDERKETNSVYSLGLVHMITQNAEQGTVGTALGVRTLTSAANLPEDKHLQDRLERMRALTADIAVLRLFRYFYALRFDGKEMRATAVELAAATGKNAEEITALLQPLVADRTLLLIGDGRGKETYEWDGNDPAITTLLFATT